MRKSIFPLLMILGCLILFSQNETRESGELIDLNGLRLHDDDWRIVMIEMVPGGGRIKLIQKKWLMYFLHWRPLTRANRELSIDYVRHQLLSFWGPDMPFTIIGEGGQTEVAGHEAYFIDGSIYDGKIKTRFIIWNCPETHRQFIADCNINKSRGTHDKFLKLQFEITSTLSCHGTEVKSLNPELCQRFHSESYHLDFLIPQNWRTHEFQYPQWFPKGLSPTCGSLWTLLTDSDKYMELSWYHETAAISEKLLRRFISERAGSWYRHENILYTIEDLELDGINHHPNHLGGTGRLTMRYRYQDQNHKDAEGEITFLSRILLWKNKHITYFLITAIMSRQSMWNLPLDLAPTPKTLEEAERIDVLPYIRVFDKSLLE